VKAWTSFLGLSFASFAEPSAVQAGSMRFMPSDRTFIGTLSSEIAPLPPGFRVSRLFRGPRLAFFLPTDHRRRWFEPCFERSDQWPGAGGTLPMQMMGKRRQNESFGRKRLKSGGRPVSGPLVREREGGSWELLVFTVFFVIVFTIAARADAFSRPASPTRGSSALEMDRVGPGIIP